MQKTRLQNISDVILQSLRKTQEIQEEQVHILFDGIVDVLQESVKSMISDESRTLFQWIQDVWQYRDFDGLSQEASFLVGSIWGAMKIVEEKQKRVVEDTSVKDLINKYDDYYWLFAAIARTPGIKHKNLAKRGAKSPSELSQFISRMESENLLTYSRTGREKYYYLQEKGRRVYEGIKKTRERSGTASADWVKRIVENNNSLDREMESISEELVLRTSVFPKRADVCKIVVKQEKTMVDVGVRNHCFFVANDNACKNIVKELKAGKILKRLADELDCNWQVHDRPYSNRSGMLLDNVLIASVGNVSAGSYGAMHYQSEKPEQCIALQS